MDAGLAIRVAVAGIHRDDQSRGAGLLPDSLQGSAVDGTWGMKKEFYPLSLNLARRVAQEMEAVKPDTYMTDCSLAALQL